MTSWLIMWGVRGVIFRHIEKVLFLMQCYQWNTFQSCSTKMLLQVEKLRDKGGGNKDTVEELMTKEGENGK